MTFPTQAGPYISGIVTSRELNTSPEIRFLTNKSWEVTKTVDNALNSTLSRTLNTSFTTLVVLVSIFLFGGESIRGFMFALIVGVLVGTYSSVFIATPVMYDSLKINSQNK